MNNEIKDLSYFFFEEHGKGDIVNENLLKKTNNHLSGHILSLSDLILNQDLGEFNDVPERLVGMAYQAIDENRIFEGILNKYSTDNNYNENKELISRTILTELIYVYFHFVNDTPKTISGFERSIQGFSIKKDPINLASKSIYNDCFEKNILKKIWRHFTGIN